MDAIEQQERSLERDRPLERNRPLDRPPSKKRIAPYLLTFLIMFFLWVLLSGRFDSFHLSLGVISCALVAFFSGDLLFTSQTLEGLRRSWWRFILYTPWLIYQIFLANLHVMYLTFHPKMMDLIDPKVFRFKSRLKGDLPLVTFANSITLTPGTITVYVTIDGEFSVHAIDQKSKEGLPGEMEIRIARVFGET